MKNLKNTSKLLSCALVVGMMSQTMTTAFAYQSENKVFTQGDVKIEATSYNSLNVKDADSENKVTVNEVDGIRIITITDLATGKSDYIKYDENANTVYSSMTGQTIDLSEHKELSPKESFISYRSTISYETKYISYSQIKSLVGGAATIAGVIGAILYFVPGAQVIGGAIGSISTIVAAINNSTNASSSHGIRLSIKVTRHYRSRLGHKHVWKITHDIASYELY